MTTGGDAAVCPEMEAVMKSMNSVAACGLVAIPPMADTPHLHESDNRLVMAGDAADPSRLARFQSGATERLVALDELASIRRELRVMVLARAAATIPRWSEIVEGLKLQAEAMPLWYLWLLAIFASLATVGSAHWMVTGVSMAKHLLGLGGVVLYATIMMQAISGLTYRSQAS